LLQTDAHLEALAQQSHADGGWGYAPGRAPQLEPTCLALLALALERDRFPSPIEGGLDFLQRNRAADASYRLAAGREEAVWPTALVLFTQAALGIAADAFRATALRLLAIRGETVKDPDAGNAQDINIQLIGWPWGEGNFSWVEPTAWAVLALRRTGFGEHPRVREGEQLLLDRAFDEGGINYGNRRIFGRITEPVPGPTSLMLLALQGRQHPRIDSAVAYLEKQAPAGGDLEHLCWAKLALHSHGHQAAWLDDRIVAARQARAETRFMAAAVVREALAALALSCDQANPFKLAADQPADGRDAPVPPPIVRSQPLKQRVLGALQKLAVRTVNSLRQPPLQSAVHIAKATDYNAGLADVLQRQYASFRERVPLKGKRVVLKPNLVEYHRDKVINTDPRIVAAVIELCQREGAGEVIVAEGPGHWRNVEYLVSASGLGDVLRHYQVSFVDLNHDEPVKQLNAGRATGLPYLYLAKTIVTAEVLISLPKLKTHHWAGATLSLKNLFGTLPGTCYGWPKNELHWRGIPNSIIDIALTRTPDLAIVDGIIGMEGDGPLNGTAKPMGVLVMGSDLVAVDATCCRLMQLDPAHVPYLMLGRDRRLGRLGEQEIEQLGESIAALAQPFDTLPEFQSWRLGRTG
jgi:uncharacterized protein (DUF362 family)